MALARAERAVPRDAVNCSYHESNEVSLRLQAEEKCLSRLRGLVERIGNALEIKLQNGATKKFFSNFEACENAETERCLQYWMSAYLPKQRAVVLKIDAWESATAALVNVDSGNLTKLEEEPHLSPSGDRFAVVKATESEDFENHIAIYSAMPDPPALEYAHRNEAGTYALYSFVRWDGDARIKLKVVRRANGAHDLKEFDTEVVRTKAGWQMRTPLLGP
jgi:hypothetical protein